MANIAISDLERESTELKDNDLILVSNNNGNGSYTSMKMKGSVLKAGGTSCQFTEDKVKNACIAALTNKNISTLTSSQVSSVIDGKNLSTLTSDQVGSVIDGKGLSTLTSDEVSSTIDSKGLSTLSDDNVLNDVAVSLVANESITDSIANIRVNQLQMKNEYDQYFRNITDLLTRIGDKVYDGTYGTTEYTLTLNTSLPSGCTLSKQPTGGGKYKDTKRVVIEAFDPTDTLNYKFSGWYQGTALISNQKSYSYEVTDNVTLTAKYEVISRAVTVTYNIKNNSSHTVGFYMNIESSSKWAFEIPPGGSKSSYDDTLRWKKPDWEDSTYCITHVKDPSTGKPFVGTLPVTATTTYGKIEVVTTTTFAGLWAEATETPPDYNLVSGVVITITDK